MKCVEVYTVNILLTGGCYSQGLEHNNTFLGGGGGLSGHMKHMSAIDKWLLRQV